MVGNRYPFACALALSLVMTPIAWPSSAAAQPVPVQTVPIRPPPNTAKPAPSSADAPAPKLARPKATKGQGSTPPTKHAVAEPATLFDGYSKVTLGGVHIGFAVSRYELDPKKNEFISTYFLKTNALGGNVTESLKARATTGFRPISYQYTSIVAGKTKTIDATFKGDQMTAVVIEDGKTTTIRKSIPKGAFPSTFLVYMMLKGKEGLKPGVRYAFVAIAEEDAAVYPGEASVVSPEPQNGIPAFKVFTTFKGVRFASFVTLKGDVLATRSNTQGIATELVKSIQEATSGQSFNPSMLITLFGRVPEGKHNAIARQEASIPATSPTPAPSPQTLDLSRPDEDTTKPRLEAESGEPAPMTTAPESAKQPPEDPRREQQ